MKGLLLFIRNNRIIYKVSIVSILILMLISVMQINPENENKKNVGAETVIDYTIRFVADTKKFYKVKGDSVVEMTTGELNALGVKTTILSISTSLGNYKGFILSNANIRSTESIAFELIGKVYIAIEDGTKNKIESSYKTDANGYYGIKVNGNLFIDGRGTLDVSCINNDTSGDKECNAIYTSDQFDFSTQNVTINAYAKGRNGIGIKSDGYLGVAYTTINAYGGSSGNTAGMYARDGLDMWYNDVHVESSSTDGTAYGLATGKNGDGDSIDVRANKFEATISSKVKGAVIQSGKITVRNNCEFNAQINGKNISGIKSIGNEGQTNNAININENANILIAGDINGQECAALYADNSNINIESGQVNINLKNTTDNNRIVGIYATNDKLISNGNMTVTGGKIMSKVICQNGIGIEVAKDISAQGGNIVSCSNGQAAEYSNLVLKKDADPYMDVLVASTDIDCKTSIAYDVGALSTYKYIEIGEIHNYYIQFNPSNGSVKKMDANGEELGDLLLSELSGWSVENNNTLVLSGLDFTTTCNKAIDVIGTGTIRLEDDSNNRIVMANTAKANNTSCISCSDNLTMNGAGNIDLITYSNDNISYLETIYAEKGISIVNNNINICISKNNVDSNKSYGIRSFMGNFDINNCDININAESKNLVRGFFLDDGDSIDITNSNVNMDFNADVQAEVIYSACTEVNIANTNMELKCLSALVYGICAYTDLNISDTVIDLDTFSSANTYGIYSDNGNDNDIINIVNSKVKVCSDINKITYGIELYPGDINVIKINNSSVEVTAKCVITTVPTLEGNISISEARVTNSSTGDVTVTTPGIDTSSVTTYDYIRIEPTYYLTYNATNKQMYINDTDTPAPVSNWYVKEDGTLVLDGFNFTTSNNYGLKIVGDTVIELAEGSNNSIAINYIGENDSVAIYSDNKLDIIGMGKLDIICNPTNNKTDEITSNTKGLVINNNILTITDASVNISVVGEIAYGISAKQNVTFENAKINVKVKSDKTKVIGIESTYNDVSISKSDVKLRIDVTKEDTECYGICAYGAISIIENSIVDVIGNDAEIYGITLYNGDNKNIYINDSTININGKQGYGIYAHASYGTYVENIEINNSNVTVNMGTEGGGSNAYGIYAPGGNININYASVINMNLNTDLMYGIYSYKDASIANSEITIIAPARNDSNRARYGISSKQTNVNLSNTTTTINIGTGNSDSEGICGIAAFYGSISISGGTTSVTADGYKVTGIHAGNIFMDNPSFYIDQVIDINILDEAVVNVNVTGKSNDNYVYGIVASKGKSLVISDSKVTSNVESVGNCSAIVIDKDNTSAITITSSDVTVNSTTTGTGTTVKNYGIISSGSVTVTGKLNSSSNKVNNLIMSINGCNRTYGIYANQDITLKDMKLVDMDINMTNETDNSWAYGIYAINKNVDIENCVMTLDAIVQQGVDAISTDGGSIYIKNGSDIDIVTNGEVYGILSYAQDYDNPIKSIISINNSDIFIKAGSGEAIYTDGWDNDDDEIIISDSNINISLGSEEAVGYMDFAIYNSEGTILINNSVINIGMYSSYAFGIECKSGLEINDSYINIDIKKADNVGTGIRCLYADVICSKLREGSVISISGGNASFLIGLGSLNNGVKFTEGNLTIDVNGNEVFGIGGGTSYINNPSYYNNEVTDVNISNAKINIISKGVTSSSSVSGIRTTKGNITLTDSDIQVINDNSDATDDYGLRVDDDKKISITRGTLVTKGRTKAIGVSAVDKLILDKGGDMSAELIEGSTVYAYTPSDIIDYPSINSLASYKYIKIGEVPTYYYRYTNNKLYKVSKDSTVTELNSTTWPTGCSVTEDGKLELNGFNFVTTANKVIDIVGEANVLVSGINTIRNVCNTVAYSYGIYSDSIINITSTEGTLNANYVNHNYLNENGKYYIALYSEKDISIDGGSYIVNAQEDNTIGVDGQNITIQNASVNVKGQVKNSGMGIYMSNYSNTVKNINILDTDVEVNIKSLYKGDNNVYAIYGENYDLEYWNTVGEINMTGGSLVANIEGYVADGIYGDYNNISIDGTTMVIKSSVMDGINTLSGRKPSANGIENYGTLELENVNINIIADNKDTYTGSALYSEQNMSIISSDIIVQINGDNSLGIESSANLTIKNSTVDAKGGKSAIAVDSTGICNVNGRVDASTTVDGTLSYIKDSVFNTHYTEYKHVKIVPKVISVNITWGDMDFKYSESDWNASSHDYDTKTWSNNTTDGDKITVANAGSNVPVTASIAYNKDSNYTGITGTILQSKEPATEYTNNTTVTVGSSIDAYLSLNGSLSSSTTPRTIIGNVTVTISE